MPLINCFLEVNKRLAFAPKVVMFTFLSLKENEYYLIFYIYASRQVARRALTFHLVSPVHTLIN